MGRKVISTSYSSVILKVSLPTPFVEETIVSLLNRPGTLVKNQLTINVLVYLWTLNSILFVYKCILMPVSFCYNYCSFVVSFEIGKCEASDFFLFFKIILALQGPLQFYMNLAINFYISVKETCWNFDRNYVESIAFIFVIWNSFLNIEFLIDNLFFFPLAF